MRVFYSASNLRVALDESEAERGERFAVIWSRVRKGYRHPIRLVGELEWLYSTGCSLVGSVENATAFVQYQSDDPQDLEKSVFSDSILAQLFRRDTKDYQATSLLSANHYKKGNGIAYPSVRTIGGINSALPAALFDSHHEVVCAEEVTVSEHLGNSIYRLEYSRRSSAFLRDGTINWSHGSPPPHEFRLGKSLTVDPEFIGWRVKP